MFAEANALLDRIIAEKLLTARGGLRIFSGERGGRRCGAVRGRARGARCWSASTFCVSRRIGRAASRAGRWRTSSRRRRPGCGITIGAFAVTSGIGLKELTERFRAEHDDYNAIMAEAIADRLAEAFAECLHKRVRDEWGYGREEKLSTAELIQEKYRGIRPAPGYPACPDHTEKGTIWRLLDVEAKTGMRLTESFAMWPGSSVSGFYFAHPESRYFSLGKIDREQVADFAERKGMSVAEVERWLAPNLNYDSGR